MKKIINGHLYCTESATEMGHFVQNDIHYSIYKTRSRLLFLYQYSLTYPWASDFKKITPVTEKELSEFLSGLKFV